LFDVVLSNESDHVTRQIWIGVKVIDRRGPHDGEVVVAQTDFRSLPDAMRFAREAVTEWMKETEA
jgi:hypothetical protein